MNKITEFFISLGAGNHQIPLIKAAKSLGFQIIAIDRDLMAPGMAMSDFQIQSDITDYDGIIDKISHALLPGKISGISGRSFGKVTQSLTMIARHFELPGPGMPHAEIFLNKQKLKNLLGEKGIQVPGVYSWTQLHNQELFTDSRFPVLVRPCEGFGKKGLELIETSIQLSEFLRNNPIDDRTMFVESLVEGREYTVLGLVRNGQYQTLSISDKITSRHHPLFIELGHVWPSTLSRENQNKISEIINKIVRITGVQNAPFVAEFIVEESDNNTNIFLVECAPETGGEFLADALLPKIHPTLNYFQELVKLQSHFDSKSNHPFVPKPEPGLSFVISFIPQQEGQIKHIRVGKNIKEHEDLVFVHLLKQNGNHTSLSNGNSDRLAVFCLSSTLKTVNELQAEAEELKSDIEVAYE